MIVEACDITVRRGARTVLDKVSLEARPGEMLGLLGPNGAGKTTLLRMLSALEEPVHGSIQYGGRSAQELGRRELGRTIAYLAQGGSIHWPMTVEHVVALGRLPHDDGPQADAEAIARAMAAAEIMPLAGRTTGTLSGGERMRVLLARALAVEGKVLLADEPVAALDPYHQLHVMELLAAQARAGTTVIVVLHDLTLAARFCHKVALLHRGRIRAMGQPEQVLSPESLRNVYGIEVECGQRHGQPFILPWSRASQTPGAETDA
ncbi:ABC transporter ATP-binding protein [Xanthobacter sp. TB0139]|uniref:ABC transporter ATP-binding protein n=1 Tax=Xanthobacter sp. TB0139 TaxID=3459178 RepID=UPI0040395ED8